MSQETRDSKQGDEECWEVIGWSCQDVVDKYPWKNEIPIAEQEIAEDESIWKITRPTLELVEKLKQEQPWDDDYGDEEEDRTLVNGHWSKTIFKLKGTYYQFQNMRFVDDILTVSSDSEDDDPSNPTSLESKEEKKWLKICAELDERRKRAGIKDGEPVPTPKSFSIFYGKCYSKCDGEIDDDDDDDDGDDDTDEEGRTSPLCCKADVLSKNVVDDGIDDTDEVGKTISLGSKADVRSKNIIGDGFDDAGLEGKNLPLKTFRKKRILTVCPGKCPICRYRLKNINTFTKKGILTVRSARYPIWWHADCRLKKKNTFKKMFPVSKGFFFKPRFTRLLH